jgi:hypothetical protein
MKIKEKVTDQQVLNAAKSLYDIVQRWSKDHCKDNACQSCLLTGHIIHGANMHVCMTRHLRKLLNRRLNND